MNIPKERLVEMYRMMCLIRNFEYTLNDLYSAGKSLAISTYTLGRKLWPSAFAVVCGKMTISSPLIVGTDILWPRVPTLIG